MGCALTPRPSPPLIHTPQQASLQIGFGVCTLAGSGFGIMAPSRAALGPLLPLKWKLSKESENICLEEDAGRALSQGAKLLPSWQLPFPRCHGEK